MRKFLVIMGFMCSVGLISAQQNNIGCGTEFPANYSHAEWDGTVGARASTRYVPIVYHLVARANGTGAISLKDVFEAHCELNADFAVLDMGFYIFKIDTIKEDALFGMSNGSGGTNTSLGYQAFTAYNVSGKCNVYITGALPGLCGFATFPNSAPARGGIFLNKACVGANEKTFPHEMGHYLNLAHTFESFQGVELVTRGSNSNCSSAGDGFCDTPADFLDFRVPCPYTGGETDPNGYLYRTNLDETLFMSYFNDDCISRFSDEESAEMNNTLSTSRSNLLGQTLPDFSALDSALFLSPINGDIAVNSSAVTFKWNSIPGAKYYLFRLQPSTSSALLLDTVITDTSYTVPLLATNKTYKYFVRPISFGNTCGELTSFQYATTSLIKVTPTVVKPSCPGESDATISLVPTNGTAPYIYSWSNGETTSSLSNLPAGDYTVTVTDNNNKIVIATIVVNNSAAIIGSINKVGGNLNAYASGGTGPYTYNWSNTVTGQFNNNIDESAVYSVTITDAKGCIAIKTFPENITGINDLTSVSIKVYPNPVANVSSVNFQIELNKSTVATVTIKGINGNTIQQIQKTFEAGVNTTAFEVNNLASGVYFVQFTSKEINHVERFSVFK